MKAHFSLFPFILNVHHNQLDPLTFSIKTGVWKPVWHCIALNPVYCEDFSLLLRDSFTQGIHWKSPWSTQLHGNSGWKLMKESKLLTVSYKACCLRTKTKKTYQLRIHSEQIIKNLKNDKNWKTETKISVCMFEKWMKGKNICVCVFVCACKRVCVHVHLHMCWGQRLISGIFLSVHHLIFWDSVSLSLWNWKLPVWLDGQQDPRMSSPIHVLQSWSHRCSPAFPAFCKDPKAPNSCLYAPAARIFIHFI